MAMYEQKSKPYQKSIEKYTRNINKNVLNSGIFKNLNPVIHSDDKKSISNSPYKNLPDTNEDVFFQRSKYSFNKISPFLERAKISHQTNKFYGLFHKKDKNAFNLIVNASSIIDNILKKSNSSAEALTNDEHLKELYNILEKHCISYLNSYCRITFTKEARQRKVLVQSILKKCHKFISNYSNYWNNFNEQKLIQYYNKPEFHTVQVHDPSNLKSFNSSPFNQAINAEPESILSTIPNNKNLVQASSKDSSSSPYAIHFYDPNDKTDIVQKNNVINYPNYIIKKIIDNSNNKEYTYKFKSLSQNYDNEDIKKPPVFETFFITNLLGDPKFSILAPTKHAYMGLRYTECYKIGSTPHYQRKRLLIGFSRINKNTSDIDSGCNQSNVATQTQISITKVPKLLYNITCYFNRYKYKLLSRNCNTFVKDMAKSIGLNNISKLHSNISPSTSGNKIISAIAKDAKKNKFGQFYKGWDSAISLCLQRKPAQTIDSGINRYVLLGLNRVDFLQEVLHKLLRLDLGYKKQSSILDNSFQKTDLDSKTKINKDDIMSEKIARMRYPSYNKFNSDYQALSTKIINSFRRDSSKQKNVEETLNTINEIASKLEDIEIVLRSGKMLWKDGQVSVMKQVNNINELQNKIEAAMKLCAENKYMNSLLYLSEVRDMFETVKYKIPKYQNSPNKDVKST